MACGLENKPTDHQVELSDAAEANEELAVDESIEDIYKCYKVAEDENRVCDYMPRQSNINEKTRMELVDWLVGLHNKFGMLPETLYLTIDVLDRYLSKKVVSEEEFRLVGICSLLVACKYEEAEAPRVDSLMKTLKLSGNEYTRERFIAMEIEILLNLEWDLRVATPNVFLLKLIRTGFPGDKEMENMALYLVEIGLLQYQMVASFCPSLFAAAAVYTASHNLNRTPGWTETLKQYTGYSEEELKGCAKMLIQYQLSTKESELEGVQKKFSITDRGAVALLPPSSKFLDT